MYDTQTPEQYMQLLDQILFEVEELIRCAEDEGEAEIEFARDIGFFRDLRQSLQNLRGALVNGEHEFGKGKDLPFMGKVRSGPFIPFRPMLDALNATYRDGFPRE